jgi:hypothetical protein
MAYTRGQRKVQRRIVRIGRRRGEVRREILANLQTGGAESSWRNLGYGDADSEGYRQERRRYYRNPRNLGAAINRWYDEANEFPNLRGAALAQAVQQSAFPDRYKAFRGEAKQILAREGGRGTTSTARRIPGVDNSDLRQQLKLDYLAHDYDPDALLTLARGLKGAGDVPGRLVRSEAPVRGADGNVSAALQKALKWERRKVPYQWGGGHASIAKPGQPVDCSGFVSAVLGLKHPLVSGELAHWGKPGPGRHITVYANDGHTFLRIGRRWFGTSRSNPGGGAGEIPRPSASYLAQFTARHPG